LNISKPTLDIIFFAKKLAELLGWIGPGCVIGWYFISGVVLKTISPKFGRMTAIE
jgi:ATP-binding cassette, subfamily D (ALD), member 3